MLNSEEAERVKRKVKSGKRISGVKVQREVGDKVQEEKNTQSGRDDREKPDEDGEGGRQRT